MAQNVIIQNKHYINSIIKQRISGFNLWPFVLLTCAGQFFNEDIVIISELMLNNKFLRSNYI